MTTHDFITSAFNGKTKIQKCASVFIDNGAVYSYGYHYPLLFKVNGKVIRNVRGYSSTTGRHILWSRGVNAVDIHTLNSFRLGHDDNENLLQLVRGQIQYVEGCELRISHHRTMKRRENTRVFTGMVRDLNNAIANLKELQA